MAQFVKLAGECLQELRNIDKRRASYNADTPRTLNELGQFSTVTYGIIFHNMLASSAYGYLQHGTFEPGPTTSLFCCRIV